MGDLINAAFGAQVSQILVLAGIAFLFVAVAGNISGKIDPGKQGRLAAGAIGGVLLVSGVAIASWPRSTTGPTAIEATLGPKATATLVGGCSQLRCTPVAELPHIDRVRGIAYEATGRRLVSATFAEPQVRLWDPVSGSPVGSFPLQIGARITSLAGEPSMGIWPCRFATGRADGSVELWSTGGDHPGVVDWSAPKRHAREVRALAWDSRGELLASAALDGIVSIWAPAKDTQNPLNDLLKELSPQHGANYALTWRPSGQRVAPAADCSRQARANVAEDHLLAIGAGDGSVLLGNPIDEALEPIGGGQTQAVVSLAWSPDGRRLASGSLDGSIALLDPLNKRPLGRQQIASGAVYALAWSENGLLASGAEDGVARIWRVDGDQIVPVAVVAGIDSPVTALEWSMDTLAIGLERTLKLVRITST